MIYVDKLFSFLKAKSLCLVLISLILNVSGRHNVCWFDGLKPPKCQQMGFQATEPEKTEWISNAWMTEKIEYFCCASWDSQFFNIRLFTQQLDCCAAQALYEMYSINARRATLDCSNDDNLQHTALQS